jgi:hypothetical protein
MMAPKDILTREFLEEHFVRLRKSARQIAKEFGIRSQTSVNQFIKKFGLVRSGIRTAGKYLTKEFLEEHYVRQAKGTRAIAAMLGMRNRAIIKHRLKKFGIPMRTGFNVNEAIERSWANKSHGFKGISKRYWSSLMNGASTREIVFGITIEQAWEAFMFQGGKCALTGELLRFKLPGEAPKAQTASLDRKDSSLGYVVSNLQWIHKRVQKMKWAYDEREFVLTCRQIAEYRRDIA